MLRQIAYLSDSQALQIGRMDLGEVPSSSKFLRLIDSIFILRLALADQLVHVGTSSSRCLLGSSQIIGILVTSAWIRYKDEDMIAGDMCEDITSYVDEYTIYSVLKNIYFC